MTTQTITRSATTVPEASPVPGRTLRIAAGAALISVPLLWAAGMWTSPSASGTSNLDYVTSLGADATQTQVSALFLHYGNLFLGLGILAAVSLVRGRKGLALTTIGALMASVGSTNVSGTLLSDWWNYSVVKVVGAHDAAQVFATFKGSSLLPVWTATEMLATIGSLVVLVGLARAGVLAWWSIGLLLGGMAGLFLIPWDLPHATAAAVLVAFAPFAMVGARLLQRARVTG